MLAPHADALIGHVRANRDRYLDELKAWIAVPSISAQPDHAADVRRSAEHAVERMRAAGLTDAAVLDTPPHWTFIGYFCLGFPVEDGDAPVLEREGWETRRPPASVLFVR